MKLKLIKSNVSRKDVEKGKLYSDIQCSNQEALDNCTNYVTLLELLFIKSDDMYFKYVGGVDSYQHTEDNSTTLFSIHGSSCFSEVILMKD